MLARLHVIKTGVTYLDTDLHVIGDKVETILAAEKELSKFLNGLEVANMGWSSASITVYNNS